MNWQVGVCFGKVINFGDFAGDGDDSIVSEIINGEGDTYKCDDDPAIPFLMVFGRGGSGKDETWVYLRQLGLSRRLWSSAFIFLKGVFLNCLHILFKTIRKKGIYSKKM